MLSNKEIKSLFLLDESITFLNFGSFGACPKSTFEDYQKWQLELEREPVQFITVNGLDYLKNSRKALAQYLNCHYNNLVFITNPSYGVNLIAKSFNLNEGDEILTTNLEYGACDKTWEYYCEKKNASYVKQEITLPLTSKEKFIEDFFKGLTNKTKAIFISHITSSTGLIFPVKEICDIAKQKGLITFVDGAHAPGQVPLDLTELDVDIYVGACHKWMMAPKGCSFLYVKEELQAMFDPLIISWGFNSAAPSESAFIDYHQMQGTRDFSAFLTIPKVLEFMETYDWKTVSQHSKNLVLLNAREFCDLVGTEPISPISEEFIGQLFSIPIHTDEPEKLQKHLFNHYKIEIPVMRHGQSVYLRFSINGFNTQSDLDNLHKALEEIINTTHLITIKK